MRPLTESCRPVIESGSHCREPVKMFQGAGELSCARAGSAGVGGELVHR